MQLETQICTEWLISLWLWVEFEALQCYLDYFQQVVYHTYLWVKYKGRNKMKVGSISFSLVWCALWSNCVHVPWIVSTWMPKKCTWLIEQVLSTYRAVECVSTDLQLTLVTQQMTNILLWQYEIVLHSLSSHRLWQFCCPLLKCLILATGYDSSTLLAMIMAVSAGNTAAASAIR